MRVKLKTWRHTEESRVAACILQSQAENWKLSMQTITVANEYHTDKDPVFREDVRNEKKIFIEKGLFRYLAAIVKIALWWTLKHHFQRDTNSNSIKLSISLILNGNLHTNLGVRARLCPMSDVGMECIHFQFLPRLCARCVHFFVLLLFSVYRVALHFKDAKWRYDQTTSFNGLFEGFFSLSSLSFHSFLVLLSALLFFPNEKKVRARRCPFIT